MDIKQIAINYIKTLNSDEKMKLKSMLSHKILCCKDYAAKNQIPPEILNAELKRILLGDEQ